MENNQASMRSASQETSIDIIFLVRAVLKNWWVILLTACIVGMWVYMGISMLKVPQYHSSATLIIASKNQNNIYRDTVVEKAANQFQRIFTSDALENTIIKKLGKNSLPGTLSAEIEEATNLLIVTGTSSDPMDAYQIVSAALENYMVVSDYVVTDFVLETMREPEIPMQSADVTLARTMAIRTAAITFLAAAVFIAFVFLMRDDIKNEKQAKNALDIPLFATVYFESKRNLFTRKMRKKKNSILITNTNVSFSYKETISKLATKLDYQAKKEGKKVVLIASVSENEGKSTIASNLALALAKKQKDVLLIDTDLRRPALYKVFEMKIEKDQEIGNYLVPKKSSNNEKNQVKIWKKEETLRESSTGLYCLFGTKKYGNSDRLIHSPEMKQLIQKAKESMDYIILDSPPGMVASDAELLAEQSDMILLVVRQGVSGAGEINDMTDNLLSDNQVIMGTVFNAVKSRVIPWNGQYGYSSDYYGSYYKSYDKSKKNQEKAGGANNANIQ